jgi:prepilin peptidase CpaA
VLFVLGVVCWRRGWLGGGDVKLIAAVGFVLPPLLCPAFIAAMAIAGGVLAMIYGALALLLRHRTPPRPRRNGAIAVPLWRRVLCAERWRLSRGAPLPYATAIAAGYLFILLRG